MSNKLTIEKIAADYLEAYSIAHDEKPAIPDILLQSMQSDQASAAFFAVALLIISIAMGCISGLHFSKLQERTDCYDDAMGYGIGKWLCFLLNLVCFLLVIASVFTLIKIELYPLDWIAEKSK